MNLPEPEPIACVEVKALVPLLAAGPSTYEFEATYTGDQTEDLLSVGMSFGSLQDRESEYLALVFGPLEIFATMIAAIRHNAEHQGMLPALNAAIDRHDAIWRNIQ